MEKRKTKKEIVKMLLNVDLLEQENTLKSKYRELNRTKINYEGQERSISYITGMFSNSNRDIRLVLQIIDIRHAPSKNDLQMLDFLSFNNFRL